MSDQQAVTTADTIRTIGSCNFKFIFILVEHFFLNKYFYIPVLTVKTLITITTATFVCNETSLPTFTRATNVKTINNGARIIIVKKKKSIYSFLLVRFFIKKRSVPTLCRAKTKVIFLFHQISVDYMFQ